MEHDGREGQEPRMRAGDRDQWVRVLATKPEDLSSIPDSHGGRRTDSQVVLCPSYGHLNTPAYTHTHKKSQTKSGRTRPVDLHRTALEALRKECGG